MDHSLNKTDCIVLAGGFGTRLKSVVSDVPKPMAPINGIPFLSLLLQQLHQKGLAKFILAVGYKSEYIQSYFSKNTFPFSVAFSIEDEPLGTGGAIRLAMKKAKSSTVLIVNGDTYFDFDVQNFVEQAILLDKECVLTLKKIDNSERYGTVKIEGNCITQFIEKQFQKEAYINAGVYCINKSKFNLSLFPKQFSFEKAYLEAQAGQKNLFGIAADGYFIDIGIPEDYEKAQDDFDKFKNR
jgi:D-glycero-alpha-D-manno-heptose 1-phosphate guanylyltransferase